MIRIRGLVVLVHVTRSAIHWGASELAVDVALRTLHLRVRTGQWELRGGVVKLRSQPRRCGVAGTAIVGEASLYVIGIGGAVEILRVAREAIRRC